MKWGGKPKLILAGALLAACAFAGGAWAASAQRTPASSRQAFINDVARRLGTTPQKLDSALEGAYIDQLNAAVQAGRLTRAQANAIEQAVRRHGFGAFGPLFFGPPPPLNRAFRGVKPPPLPPELRRQILHPGKLPPPPSLEAPPPAASPPNG